MPGGGYFYCAAGQVTEDSEMMMSLIHGYLKCNKKQGPDDDKIYDYNIVASQYARWYMS